ncbi:hypothetical protein [Collimonas sp. OK607]|uniref:hypothetical protein n=1 Tax=Collimonas sp. OK607 TaxID=1798194 RepID=UPI0011145117|nr:hypothetical protein [Collimonas sp. OK607]
MSVKRMLRLTQVSGINKSKKIKSVEGCGCRFSPTMLSCSSPVLRGTPAPRQHGDHFEKYIISPGQSAQARAVIPLEDHDFMIEMITSFAAITLLLLESIDAFFDFFHHPNKGRKIQPYVISRYLFHMVK